MASVLNFTLESTGPRSFNTSQLKSAPTQRHPLYDGQLSELGEGLGNVLNAEVVEPGD